MVNIIHASIDTLKWCHTGESQSDLKLKVPIGNTMSPCSEDIGNRGMNVSCSKVDGNFKRMEGFEAINSVEEMVNFLKKSQDARERSWKY